MENSVTMINFIEKSRDAPVLVVFTMNNCPPCKMLKPILSELEKERSDCLVVYVNVDTNPKLVSEYQIRSVPTLILFNIGKPISRASGFLSKIQLNKWLNTELPVEWTEIKGS